MPSQEYRNNHLEEIKQKGRLYYLKNKDKINLKNRNNYYKNKELYLKQGMEYARLPENRKRRAEYEKLRRSRRRFTVLSHYSNGDPKCNKCGFSDIRALSMDHINNDGYRHRREIGTGERDGCSSTRMYVWLITP